MSLSLIWRRMIAATIANGGTRYVPHLLRRVDEGKGWQVVPAPEPRSKVEFKPETIEALHEGLWLVVNGAGTGGNAKIAGKDVAGKTGTAQVISLQGGKGKTDFELRDHGWFVFFAPRNNPEIAGAVFAEHALHGAEAARIARHLMETYFAKKESRPLPEFVPPKQPATVPPSDVPRETVPAERVRGAGTGTAGH